eukprot:gnl/TRDRNA2_/TRDRNA2_64115_c1_seq1.p1 gnl/TRDRNA2_/TRDRNA2_64115_c1~~gnl/TRDRNA2_/TRDRNA2_64115_c1_seq1.p1  ORF type:complete len:245 (+),score=21.49 gnl/TRDRNA2_/TRDRNA2_64115_c1_seq1:108-737(+)
MASADPRREIITIFENLNLPIEVAHRLTDPDGEYDYSDLVSFAQFVTFEDLRAAGLKVAGARSLKASLQPGGEVFNQLVFSGRLVPTKAEPPKCGEGFDAGNPNDGSSVSGLTSSSSSGNTQMTSVRVPRRVRERVEAFAPQVYERDKLNEELGQHFSNLHEASSVAFARGAIDLAGYERRDRVNKVGNSGKHDPLDRLHAISEKYRQQ